MPLFIKDGVKIHAAACILLSMYFYFQRLPYSWDLYPLLGFKSQTGNCYSRVVGFVFKLFAFLALGSWKWHDEISGLLVGYFIWIAD